MPRSAPTTITLPPFSGAVRKLVYTNTAIFFLVLLLRAFVPGFTGSLLALVLLQPVAAAHGMVWQIFTYSFFHFGIFDILFTMLTLWFCGSILEGAYGSRFLTELYFVSVIGGAILASAISFTRIFHLSPYAAGSGAWAGLFGVLIGLAMRFGDQEFTLFPLPIRIRAKYLVAIDILIALAVVFMDQGAFAALLELAGAAAGFLYLQYSPRRGVAYGLSERYFGLRNSWYRYKRRRAARKFEVYMGKQGRVVSFDKEGRYLDPDEERKNPKDKRWMN
jgi:membrane associated rhomboid family serine protease